MTPQFNNILLSSSLLWLNHVLANDGQGYYNVGTRFYPTNQRYNGYYAYSAPYKQFVFDSSVSGATIPTGIYVNNVFVGPGVSGFAGFNMEEGLALFSTQPPTSATISGNYSAREIAVKNISEQEESIVLEKKFINKNKTNPLVAASGYLSDQVPFPVAFMRVENDQNIEFAFGGEESSNRTLRISVFADSEYLMGAIKSLLVDKTRTYIPLHNIDENPLDRLGRLTGVYNFTGLYNSKVLSNNAAFISNISALDYNTQYLSEFKKINDAVYLTVVDIETQTIRFPRA